MRKLPALLVSAAAVLLTTALPASATEPEHIPINDTGNFTTTDICDFALHVNNTVKGMITLFYDRNGDLIKVIGHFAETDTYSAHGESLTSKTYHYNAITTFEGDNITTVDSGVAIKVPLPDGAMFLAAGRLTIPPDFMGNFVYQVDTGVVKNRDAFCAALS
jgi:hypothetical protein